MKTAPANPDGRRPFWCKKGPARRTLRWCRRSGYVAGAVVLYGAFHLNQIGLPGFAKDFLVGQLRERGLDLEFSRMRIRLGRGIVAENVNVGRAEGGMEDQLFVDQIQLKLDWWTVLRFRPEIRAVTLHGGKVALPISATNAPAVRFEVEEIEGLLVFAASEHWVLEHLRGRVLGGAFDASGSFTNAGALRRKKEGPSEPPGPWRRVLLRTVQEAETSVFATPPELKLRFEVDLADRMRSSVDADLHAAGAVTSYGSFENVSLHASLNGVPVTNGLFTAALRLESGKAAVLDGVLDGLRWNGTLRMPTSGTVPAEVDWALHAETLGWRGNALGSIDVTGRSVPAPSPSPLLPWNPVPGTAVPTAPTFRTTMGLTLTGLSVTNVLHGGPVSLQAEAVHSRHGWSEAVATLSSPSFGSPWGESGQVRAKVRLQPAAGPDIGLPSGSGWRFLQSVAGELELEAKGFTRPDIAVDSAATSVSWGGGVIGLGRFDARLFGGGIEATGRLDVATRQAELEYRTDADPTGAKRLLREAGRRWLDQFGWSTNRPPQVQGRLAVTFPSWETRGEQLRTALQDTLRLEGRFEGGPFTFRGVSGEGATGAFRYVDRVWRLENLQARRPEGVVRLDYEGDERTKVFRFDVAGRIDPMAAKPLLTNAATARVFGDFEFPKPLELSGTIQGVWLQPQRIGFSGRVLAEDFRYRGDHFDSVSAVLGYTNRFLSVADAKLRDGPQTAVVEGFAYDVAAGLISFTNGVAHMHPDRVTRLIGPKTHAMMQAYHFPEVPSAKVNGVIGVYRDPSRNDIRFEIVHAPRFRWWKLNAEEVSGTVHSLGSDLYVTNLAARFHGGRLKGHLQFDLAPGTPDGFRIDAQVEDANLHTLVTDLSDPGRTNQLEGAVSATLRIADGITTDQRTWKGSGEARLKDGYLWDQPLFGALSSVLSEMSSGLGKTRFNEGTAHYTISDGRVHTRDLRLRAPSMGLAFVGSVGFERDLDMVVNGSLFRSLPLLGPMASIALSPFEKLFEYKVTGTLDKPKTEPAHIPTLFMIPLNPIGTLRDLFPDSRKASPPVLVPPAATSTNAPTAPGPVPPTL